MRLPSNPPPASDPLARYRAGDLLAFRELVDRYQDRLLRFFYRQCFDRGRAEDLTQELFVKLILASRSYRPEGRLDSFVWKLATNLWIDTYRSLNLGPRRPARIDDVGGEVLAVEPAPAEALALEEDCTALRSALLRLPPAHRLVIELAVHQALPYAEIAELLAIPVGTVKSRMHHAIANLKRQLGVETALATNTPPERGGEHGA